MKKALLNSFLLLFAVCLAYGVNAQQLQEVNRTIALPAFTPLSQTNQAPQLRATTGTCGPDSLLYAISKATGLQALSINNATSALALAQYFNAPQDITVNGATFYGWKSDTTGGISINVNVHLYLAGPDSAPTGTPLASTIVPVDTVFGGGTLAELAKYATFTTPVTVNQPYVIVVENNSPVNIALISNSYTAADGAQEWLSSVNIGGNWLRSYTVVIGATPYDADVLIEPHVNYDLTADFTAAPPCVTGASTVTFTDASSGAISDRMYNQATFIGFTDISFDWDFGDGNTATDIQNTSNAYAAAGPYTVTLTDSLYMWSGMCVVTDQQTLAAAAPVSSFTTATAGTQVTFTDASTGGNSWLWDFGDGNTSTMQNPVHTYGVAGTYTVCLTSTNGCGSDSTCMTMNVGCVSPVAGFTNTANNLIASFADATTNGPTSWFYDFGDGNTSTMQNPTHTYAAPGTYTVCLITSNTCGADTACQAITITCTPGTTTFSSSSTNYDATFTDATTPTPTSWLWDLGDGNTSTMQNPTHTYAAPGTYTVCLTTTDICGTDSTCQSVTITCPAPVASFTESSTFLTVDFGDASTAQSPTYLWDFGDGNTSTQASPTHTYGVDGTYLVCLTVTDVCGSDSSCMNVSVIADGIEESALANLVSIYPNPANDNITLSTGFASATDLVVDVLDVTGKVVMSEQFTGVTEARLPISIAPMAEGAYLVRVQAGGESTTIRLLKVR